MMAEVGVIVKVSGSRIATPLAPPRPGSTPISTPSMMPTNIRPMFIGVSDDGEALHQCADFFHCRSSLRACGEVRRSVAEEAQRLERALGSGT